MTRWLGWAAYVAVSIFSFPQRWGAATVDLGSLLAWFGPAILLVLLYDQRPRRAAGEALIAGTLAHAAIIHWIYVVTVHHGGAPRWAGVLAPLAMSLYPGLALAAFAACYAWLRSHSAATPLAVAALFTAFDHLRSFALGGWPWATLGYAQHENASLLGLASITGVYGLSFVTVLVGAAMAEAWLAVQRRERPPRAAWLGLATAAALLLIGAAQAQTPRLQPPRSVRVAALQGNIAQGEKWDAERAERILATYLELAEQAHAAGAELVVWPESAAPGLIEANPALRAQIRAAAARAGVPHIVGAVGVELNADHTAIEKYFDSAFVVDASGRVGERYDKSHLVPFGEFLPLRGVFGRFFGALATGLATKDVTAGAGPRALELSTPLRAAAPGASAPSGAEAGAPRPLQTFKAGVPICYELLFPDLVRRFALDGGELLLAITNDAWYGRTGAPDQFLAMTALRSAETGLWTLRAANSGISAVIDAQGWVRERTPIFERKVLIADLPLAGAAAAAQHQTFYVRNGDVFAWACWGVAGIRLLRTGRQRRSGPIPETAAEAAEPELK